MYMNNFLGIIFLISVRKMGNFNYSPITVAKIMIPNITAVDTT